MNELVEALRERIAEIREQAVYNRFLEKRAKDAMESIGRKIAEAEMKMDAQKNVFDYAMRSLEKVQKKYVDTRISELEKRMEALEVNREKKAERVRIASAKLANDVRAAVHNFEKEKLALGQKIGMANRAASGLSQTSFRARKKQKELDKEISRINSRLRAIEARMRKIQHHKKR